MGSEQKAVNAEEKSSVSANEINLFDLLFVLAGHWKMIVFVPMFVALISAGYSLTMPNIYTAKALILPADDDGGGMMGAMMAQMGGLAGLAGGLVGGGTKGDLYVTMLKSETIKDFIIDKYRLIEKNNLKFRANAYAALDGSTTINCDKKDGVVAIAVDNEDPKLAAAIANSYVEELGKLAAKMNMKWAGQNSSFLEERIAKAKIDLTAAENKLKSFQMKNKALAIPEQAKGTLEGIAQLRAQLLAREVELEGMRQRFTDETPEVKSTKAAITSLRGQIGRLEGSSSQGSMPGVGAVPQLSQEYGNLMREFTIQETLVGLLTKQYEVSRLNEFKNIAPFQVLQKASIPELKSKPKRSVIVIMATFASLFLMIVAAFFLDFLSRLKEEDRRRLVELRKMLTQRRRKIKQG